MPRCLRFGQELENSEGLGGGWEANSCPCCHVNPQAPPAGEESEGVGSAWGPKAHIADYGLYLLTFHVAVSIGLWPRVSVPGVHREAQHAMVAVR